PSDEDSLSLNVPMSHITEEEGINKDDSSEHISSLTADCDSVRLIEESPTEALKDQINFRDSALSTRFVNYIKGRTAADFEEPLRIEEDSHWPTEQMSKHEMIHQLKEAVELLQDPSRAEQDDVSGVQLYPVEMVNVEESLNGQDSDDGGGTPKRSDEGVCEFQRKRKMILQKARAHTQLACREFELHMSVKHHDRYPGCGPPSFSSPVFGLKPRSAPPSLPCSPPTSCLAPPFLSQASPLRRDSAGHDGGVQRAEQDDVSGVQLYPVEMWQDSDDGGGTPKRSDEGVCEFQRKRKMILQKARAHTQLACREFELHMSVKHHDRYLGCGPPSFSSPVFGLKPRSAPPSLPCSPPTSCLAPPFLSQASPLRRDSAGHDGGVQRVFLRSHKSLESVDPQFTMRRKMEQLREELELTEHLRDSIESRLKVDLPEDLGSSLMDGVVLCHLANQIRPRSVGSIHVPSPAVPKLSMAKCRRNVENFLDACRKIGVPQSSLCSPYDIIQSRLQPLSVTVQALVSFDTSSPDRKQEVAVPSKSPAPSSPSLVSITTQTPPPSWQIWDLIGSSLLHVLCLVLLFLAYSWSELT
ncbi:hypothetical protein JOQ06_021237, partial [Pogonophryne albipinna]